MMTAVAISGLLLGLAMGFLVGLLVANGPAARALAKAMSDVEALSDVMHNKLELKYEQGKLEGLKVAAEIQRSAVRGELN